MSVDVTEKTYEPGDLIYDQGDRGHGMFLILSGTVEVSVRTQEGMRPLARFGPGDFLGDMALITNEPRAATARALTPVALEVIDDRSFERSLLQQPERCSSYLAMLMQRVRITDSLLRLEWRKQGISESQAEAMATRAGYLEAVPATFSGRSDWLDLRLVSAPETPPPRVDMIIPQVPFSIGRLTGLSRSADVPARRLSIPDKVPYQISRQHCEIIRTEQGLTVQDTESHLGTIVNGVQIGKEFPSTEALLKKGSNFLILGGRHSHFRFILELA
jgi:CRP-like cAMP-binding protein